jgi:allantoinase
VLLPQGVRAADVEIVDGRIAAICDPEGDVDEDLGNAVLMPGVVDVHVHINEPGRTHWEGFETATRAAVAGGTTTLVDMPLNSIPSTTTAGGFEAKLDATKGKLCCDVGFWGGVVPGNTNDLQPLWNAGVLGFKAFLVPSGVDEFGWCDASALREAAPILAELGAPLLAHCEVPGPLEEAADAWEHGDRRDHATWLASRPPRAETEVIELLLSLTDAHDDLRVHIVHLATERGLPLIAAARSRGRHVTAETCAHYLTFDCDDIPSGATQFKCAPPLRSATTREALWDALRDGHLDFVTTDHSPSPPDVKCLDTGRFDEAWGGVASVQLLLSTVWTGATERGFGLSDIGRWLCAQPARFAGLAGRKGEIAVGNDADLVVFDPDQRWTVDAATLHHRHAVTPYHGRELQGVVQRTYLRGDLVFADGEHLSVRGAPLKRTDTQ